jgi:hypothetical protein
MIQDLVANNAYHVKRLPRGDRVDKHISMDTDEVFGVKNAIFVL